MAEGEKSGAATPSKGSGIQDKPVTATPPEKKEDPPVTRTQLASAPDTEITYEPPAIAVDEPEPKPTWSRYGNQEAASTGRALAEAEASRKAQAEVEAPFYTFKGHRDKGNKTDILATSVGQVKTGGSIKLPDDELKRLTGMGFLFTRVKQ